MLLIVIFGLGLSQVTSLNHKLDPGNTVEIDISAEIINHQSVVHRSRSRTGNRYPTNGGPGNTYPTNGGAGNKYPTNGGAGNGIAYHCHRWSQQEKGQCSGLQAGAFTDCERAICKGLGHIFIPTPYLKGFPP